jgi:hypothetical protein
LAKTSKEGNIASRYRYHYRSKLRQRKHDLSDECRSTLKKYLHRLGDHVGVSCRAFLSFFVLSNGRQNVFPDLGQVVRRQERHLDVGLLQADQVIWQVLN